MIPGALIARLNGWPVPAECDFCEGCPDRITTTDEIGTSHDCAADECSLLSEAVNAPVRVCEPQ